MAKKSLIVKTEKLQRKLQKHLASGGTVYKNMKKTRVYNRCKLCGRPRGYLRHFALCRICFRELANNGEIMGVRKSSW